MINKLRFTKKIELYDTTLRDGAQTKGVQFSVKDKLNIISLLDDFGIDYVECGWNGTNDTDTELFRILAKSNPVKTCLTAFSSSCSVGYRPATDAIFQKGISVQVPAITLFSKFWDFQIEHALGTSNEHNVELIYDSVSYCRERFDRVIVDAEHFFDGYKANAIVALSALEAVLEAGADRLVLCDTNGGSLPSEIENIVGQLAMRYPEASFGIHCHNDLDMAVVNSIVAIGQGAVQVQGTINGIGERCGNANLCSIIPNLILKYNLETRYLNRDSLKDITNLANTVSRHVRRAIPPTQPYVGEHAFTHKAGVHISSVLKHPECYEHIDPSTVGNSRKLPVSEQSGRAAIKYNLLKLGYENLDDDIYKYILEQVKHKCYQGVLLEEAAASFELMVYRIMLSKQNPGLFLSVEHFSITEIPMLNGGCRYRVELAVEKNGKLNFVRQFGADAMSTMESVMRRVIDGDQLKIVLKRVEEIDTGFRAYLEVVEDDRNYTLCAVADSEAMATCRALADAYMWDYYRGLTKSKSARLAEIA